MISLQYSFFDLQHFIQHLFLCPVLNGSAFSYFQNHILFSHSAQCKQVFTFLFVYSVLIRATLEWHTLYLCMSSWLGVKAEADVALHRCPLSHTGTQHA